ncbi:hypothetical protein DF185_19785 [Marinifilum breve]|uniref:Uncharacterized protein n=1 Tax=Marinifilum breve TaxID=2184082 RepID=A0A2V3ZV30_9BACT|nr:hypothetical protein [Marinifilum breve]PXX96883.1 hypothetical protein DF185_19785 [Marinifilum breve]
MSKVRILAVGSTEDCISELALLMLQHDRTRDIVLGAAARVMDIDQLKEKMRAEQIAHELEIMVKGNDYESK